MAIQTFGKPITKNGIIKAIQKGKPITELEIMNAFSMKKYASGTFSISAGATLNITGLNFTPRILIMRGSYSSQVVEMVVIPSYNLSMSGKYLDRVSPSIASNGTVGAGHSSSNSYVTSNGGVINCASAVTDGQWWAIG